MDCWLTQRVAALFPWRVKLPGVIASKMIKKSASGCIVTSWFNIQTLLAYLRRVHVAQTQRSFFSEGTPFIYEYRLSLCGADAPVASCHNNASFLHKQPVSCKHSDYLLSSTIGIITLRPFYTHVKTHNLWQTCSRLAASLLQQFVDKMCSHWLSQACWQGCYKPAADLLQAWWTQQPCYKFVPTTCYRAASQQLANKLWVTNLVQLDKITALLQTSWQVLRFCVCVFQAWILFPYLRWSAVWTRVFVKCALFLARRTVQLWPPAWQG